MIINEGEVGALVNKPVSHLANILAETEKEENRMIKVLGVRRAGLFNENSLLANVLHELKKQNHPLEVSFAEFRRQVSMKEEDIAGLSATLNEVISFINNPPTIGGRSVLGSHPACEILARPTIDNHEAYISEPEEIGSSLSRSNVSNVENVIEAIRLIFANNAQAITGDQEAIRDLAERITRLKGWIEEVRRRKENLKVQIAILQATLKFDNEKIVDLNHLLDANLAIIAAGGKPITVLPDDSTKPVLPSNNTKPESDVRSRVVDNVLSGNNTKPVLPSNNTKPESDAND